MKKIIKFFEKDRKPRLSMIVLSFNNLAYLDRFFANIACFKSVSPIEFIFVDDGTPEALSIYEKKISDVSGVILKSSICKITVLCKRVNCGIADSVLKGLEESSGEFVNLKSIDDLYVTGAPWDLFLDEFIGDKKAIQFPFYWLDDKKNTITKNNLKKIFFYLKAKDQFLLLRERNLLVLGACIISAEVLKKNSLYAIMRKFKYTSEWPIALFLTFNKIKIYHSINKNGLYVYIRNKKSISNWLFQSKVLSEEHVLLGDMFKKHEFKVALSRQVLSYLILSIDKILFGAMTVLSKKKLSNSKKMALFSSRRSFRLFGGGMFEQEDTSKNSPPNIEDTHSRLA